MSPHFPSHRPTRRVFFFRNPNACMAPGLWTFCQYQPQNVLVGSFDSKLLHASHPPSLSLTLIPKIGAIWELYCSPADAAVRPRLHLYGPWTRAPSSPALNAVERLRQPPEEPVDGRPTHAPPVQRRDRPGQAPGRQRLVPSQQLAPEAHRGRCRAAGHDVAHLARAHDKNGYSCAQERVSVSETGRRSGGGGALVKSRLALSWPYAMIY